VWRYAKADKMRLVVDAEAYFEIMQQAMLAARRRILLIGWDFDTRIHLTRGRRWWQRGWNRQFPSRLGSFVPWLVRHRKQLDVCILKWRGSMLQFLTRGTMALDLLRWAPKKRIDFELDAAHPLGCSHHQKIVVIDDSLAVCGGIDMTDRRWDTREHRENDPRRKRPGGRQYGPWHDLTMLMEGPVARALDELGRDRWRRAGGKPLDPVQPGGHSVWPEGLAPHFENVEVGIARTRPAYKDDPGIDEIEQLFVLQIERAKHFIYAENQYFASRTIAESLSRRLAEPDPPEIVLVHPLSADGWIESTAMDPARDQLAKAIAEIDHRGRFHLYTPYSGETPIYVHAKLLIVDDEIIRVGSANFNNRSLRLDTECDVFIDCARAANGHCGDAIRTLRHSLLAEHCGLEEEEVGPLLDQAGSMAGMIAALGRKRSRHLRPFEPPAEEGIDTALAEREVFDPEEPATMFEIVPPRRGLFRPGSLLARGMARVKRKRRRQ
jgi:hypothetical protein